MIALFFAVLAFVLVIGREEVADLIALALARFLK